ncbi:DUF4998 domain-containing protein [Maribellus sp. YY47]|uniref:DUF4998 domain-containing protein n=1 Tax=Maribellus sp. YY47 TaxID=2929486 RepID=UPI002001D88D|nr:DUF4998 domain-containing protein [Maribellus sp. YY47]MCK3684062.1 DUF4998 domain-containing protein [Maribellus sp. YY47]
MRNIILSLIVLTALMWSCEDMYDKQEKYEGEVVYPAKYDTVIGHIGYERVEIDLMKAGRIPSSQIILGKAKKTKITYDDQEIIIDSLVSWINIPGLTQSKLYRFHITTMDEFGNESVPQEIALIPFTSTDLDGFAVSPPRVLASPSAAVVDWPNGISSVLMNYYGLKFSYLDKEGDTQSGERGADSRFFVGNLEAGKPVQINMEYKIIPIVNRTPILDTVTFSSVLNINMPTSSTEFSPAERDILQKNGVTVFTADGVSDVNELVYPVHANSLQDIFYFPNLKTLDLTGGNLFTITELAYDRNGVQDVVGGGNYTPCIRKVSDTGGQQTLKDFLEAGILEKVYYYPNSMGLDDVLAPYVASGVVELIETPQSVLLDNQFHLDGIVQDRNFTLDYTFPATDAPAGEGLENVYKLIPIKRSASFVIALPREYKFNIAEYKYLKFKIYTPTLSELSGADEPWKRLWPRIMNRMWSFGSNSDFGQEYWDIPRFYIPDEDLHKWTDITLDLSTALGRHNRVIILNIGGEPSPDPSKELVYYFANIRFEKE